MHLPNFKILNCKLYSFIFSIVLSSYGCAYHPDYPKLTKFDLGIKSPLNGSWLIENETKSFINLKKGLKFNFDSGKGYRISGGSVFEASIKSNIEESKANYNYLRPVGVVNINRILPSDYYLEWLNSDFFASGKGYQISGGRVFEASIKFSKLESKANYNCLRPVGWNIHRINPGVYGLEWLDYDLSKKLSSIGKAKLIINDFGQITLCIDANPITGSAYREINLLKSYSTRPNLFFQDLETIKDQKAEVAWHNTNQNNTIVDYEKFIVSHPKSKFTDMALSKYLNKYNWSKQLDEKELNDFSKKINDGLLPFTIEKLLTLISGHYNRYLIFEQYVIKTGMENLFFSRTQFEKGKKFAISIVVKQYLGGIKEIQVFKTPDDSAVAITFYKSGENFSINSDKKILSISLPIVDAVKGLNDFKRVVIYSSDIWNGEYINEGNRTWRKYTNSSISKTDRESLLH
jgi:hypothetical protein